MSHGADLSDEDEGKRLEQLACPWCKRGMTFEIYRIEGESGRDRLVLYCRECDTHFALAGGEAKIVGVGLEQ